MCIRASRSRRKTLSQPLSGSSTITENEGRAAHEVRGGHEPEGREGARPDEPADAAAAGRRCHRKGASRMYPGQYAQERARQPAFIMAGSGEVVTYSELERRSNQLAHLLRRHGLERLD